MKNYMIHFHDTERERVLAFLSRFNDVIINTVEPESVFITIQLEDEEADLLNAELCAQVESGLHVSQVIVENKNAIDDDNIAVV